MMLGAALRQQPFYTSRRNRCRMLRNVTPGVRRNNRQTQVVVKVSEAFKPAAYKAHKEAPPPPSGVGRVTMKHVCDGSNGLALLDVTHVRLATTGEPPPSASMPSANENTSEAYDDDDVIFAGRAHSHVVSSPGKISPPPLFDLSFGRSWRSTVAHVILRLFIRRRCRP